MGKKGIAGSAIALVLGVVLGSSVVWAPAAMGYKPWMIAGSSMRDTLYNNDLTYAKADETPKTGDVVIAEAPSEWGLDRKDLVKRVIAGPGDEVTLDAQGRLHAGDGVDDPLVDEREKQWDSECEATADGGSKTIKLGSGEWLLRGDNVNNSSDSRWVWCRGGDPVVETSQLDAVVKHVVPLGRALAALTPSSR